MDVSALTFPGSQIRTFAVTLDDDFDLQVTGLKKFARAEHIEILAKRAVSLGPNPSLFVKIRYLDPRDRRLWIDEVVFSRRESLTYRLELEARADQVQRFEANFTQFVNSFHMDCGHGTNSAASLNVSALSLAQ